MLSAVDASASLLAELRKLTGASFSELKARIARRQPVLMLPLFDNDFYASGAATLHAVVRLLESTGTDFAIYELAEGERFETRDETLSRITPEVLKNMLHARTSHDAVQREDRTHEWSFGTICRVGFLCSACFWIPVGILLSIAVLPGWVEMEWLGEARTGIAAVPAALTSAIAMTLIFDTIFAMGAAVLILLRKLGWKLG